MPFLTATQVAWWLDLSETTVLKQERDGSLPSAFWWKGEPLFSADIVLPAILQDGDVNFMGGVTLKTSKGPMWFELTKPTYRLENFGEWCAVFETREHTWHVRPWESAFIVMPEALDHFDILLDCRDEQTPEIQYEDLPDLHSAHYQFFKPLKQRFGAPKSSQPKKLENALESQSRIFSL
jgi:hypothetical protein